MGKEYVIPVLVFVILTSLLVLGINELHKYQVNEFEVVEQHFETNVLHVRGNLEEIRSKFPEHKITESYKTYIDEYVRVTVYILEPVK